MRLWKPPPPKARFPLRALAATSQWPSRYEPAPRENWPREDEPGWSENLNGVTNDGRSWFFTQNPSGAAIPLPRGGRIPLRGIHGRLWKISRHRDLANDVRSWFLDPWDFQGIDVVQSLPAPIFDDGYDHLGDLDHFEGHLYVSLEGEGSDVPAGVAVFDARTLEYVGHAPLPGQGFGGRSCSWCAVNPWNGLLYSSGSRLADARGRVRAYAREIGPDGVAFRFMGQVRLDYFNVSIEDIEGGAISRQGHLYLVSDTGPRLGGVLGFDLLTGSLERRIEVNYSPRAGVLGGALDRTAQELEGMTIWDLDSGEAPNITGQIHLIMKDEASWGADELYFKHYRVPRSEVEFI